MESEARGARSLLEERWFVNWFWLAPMAMAVALTALVLTVVGSDRQVESLGVFVFKLLPYGFAALGIATFPRRSPNWVRLLFAFLTFVPFFTFFIPRQFKLARDGIRTGYETTPAGDPSDAFDTFPQLEASFDEFYIITQAMVPFVFLVAVAAFRFGGGSFGSTIKLATAAILFMVSGAEDIMYFVVNGLWPLPERLPWISHMNVRLGHVVSRTELFVMCALHFIAIAIVFALPIDRWVDRLRSDDRSATGVGPPVDARASV